MEKVFNKKHLLIYLDFSYSLFEYSNKSNKFIFEKQFEKLIKIFKSNYKEYELFSLSYGSSCNELKIFFLLKEICIKSITEEYLKILMEIIKIYLIKRKLNRSKENYRFNYDTIGILISHNQSYYNYFNSINIIISIDILTSIEEKLTIKNKEIINKSHSEINFYLVKNNLTKMNTEFSECVFIKSIEQDLQKLNIFIIESIKTKSTKLKNENQQIQIRIEDSDPNLCFNIDLLSPFIRSMILRLWKIIVISSSILQLKHSQEKSFYLIYSNELFYLKSKEPKQYFTFEHKELTKLQNIINGVDSINFLNDFKMDSLFYIFFNFTKCIHLVLDDSYETSDRLLIINKLLNRLSENCIFIKEKGSFVFFVNGILKIIQITKKTRNIFIIKILIILNNSELQVSLLRKEMETIQSFIHSELPEILIIDSESFKFFNFNNEYFYLKDHKQIFYNFQKISYTLEISEKNNSMISIKKLGLMNQKMYFLEYYQPFFVQKLHSIFISFNYKIFTNIRNQKISLMYFKFLKSNDLENQNQIMSLITLKFLKCKFELIMWKIIYSNPLIDISSDNKNQMFKEYVEIQNFMDLYSLPIIIYSNIIKNIYKEISNEQSTSNIQLYFIFKYEFILIFLVEKFRKTLKTDDLNSKFETLKIFLQQESQKLNILAKEQKLLTDTSIDLMMKNLRFVEIHNLQVTENSSFNKFLYENYQNLMIKYCEFSHRMENGRKLFFKLMRSEIYICYEILCNNNYESIQLKYQIVCLKCMKEFLEKSRTNNWTSFAVFESKCKYENKSFSLNRSITTKNPIAILNMTYFFAIKKKYNEILFGKNIDLYIKQFYFEKITNDFNLSNKMKKFYSLTIENQLRIRNKFVSTLNSIFNFFFIEDQTFRFNEDSQSIVYNISQFKKNVVEDNEVLFKEIPKSHSILDKITENFENFRNSFLKITQNVYLLKVILFMKKNQKYERFNLFNHFFDFHEFPSHVSGEFKLKLIIKILIPNFQNIYKKINLDQESINSSIKSPSKETNFYNYILDSYLSFNYDVMPGVLHIFQNTILKSFELVFNSLYIELYLMNLNENTNNLKLICQKLKSCGFARSIKYKFLKKIIKDLKLTTPDFPSDLFNVFGINAKEFFLSLVYKKGNSNIFFNITIGNAFIGVLFYQSIFISDKEIKCEVCKQLIFELKSNCNIHFINILSFLIIQPKLLDCEIGLCFSLFQIMKFLFNQYVEFLFSQIKHNYSMNSDIIEKPATEGEFQMICIHQECIFYKNLNIKNEDIFQNLLIDLSSYLIIEIDYFYFSTNSGETIVRLLYEKNDMNKKEEIEEGFRICIKFYGKIDDRNIVMFKKIKSIVYDRINKLLNRSFELMLLKTNEINNNSPVLSQIHSIFYEFKVKIQIPDINVGALFFYFNCNLGKYYKRIIDKHANTNILKMTGRPKHLVIGDLEIELTNFNYMYSCQNYSYIYYNEENNSNNIYYLEHDQRVIETLFHEQFQTTDNYFLFGLMESLEIQPNIYKINNFLNGTKINKRYFNLCYRAFRIFSKSKSKKSQTETKGIETQIDNYDDISVSSRKSSNFSNGMTNIISQKSEISHLIFGEIVRKKEITFTIKKKSKDVDSIFQVRTIFDILKTSFYEYYIENLMSFFMLKNNSLGLQQKFGDLSQILFFLFSKKTIPKSCHFFTTKNFFHKIYLFKYFLEVIEMFINNLYEFAPNYFLIYNYCNYKGSEDLQNESSHSNEFDSTSNSTKHLINILETDIVIFKTKIIKYFETRNTLFDFDELNFSFYVFPKGMSFEEFPHVAEYKSCNYDNLMETIHESQLLLEGKENIMFPPKRFFFIYKMDFENISIQSYNIKTDIIEKLKEIIKMYEIVIKVKREIYKFCSLQKLGIQYNIERISENNSDDKIYSKIFSSKGNFNEIHSFTDLVRNLMNPKKHNLLLAKQLSNDIIIKKIIDDISKLQFFFINNFNSSQLKTISLGDVR